MIDKNEIPQSWEVVKLGEVCEIIMGQSPPSSTYNTIGIGLPFFQGKKEFKDLHPVVEKWCSKPTKIAEPNDILLSVRAPVGATNLANQKCCIGRGLAAIRSQESNLFVFNFLKLIEKKLDEKGTGTTFKAISGEVLRETEIPLPPLPEQHRIVSKIEKLFTELDKGIETLKTTQQQLKVYRQAVLKWAFEGKLTNEGVKKNEGMKELKNEIGEINQSVEIRGSDNGLPDGWRLTKLKEICRVIGGVAKGKKYDGQKTIYLPYLRVANVQEGYLDLRVIKQIEILPSDEEKYKLKNGDILYTEGGDKDKLGRGTIWRNEVKNCIHQNHVFRARPFSNEYDSRYIAYYSQTKDAKNYFYKNGKQTTNLASINLTVLSNLPIPICNLSEQTKVVGEIESRLSVCDKMEETIENALQQAEALRLSILKKAFEGKLVEQSTKDEPAYLLMKKLRNEKMKGAKVK